MSTRTLIVGNGKGSWTMRGQQLGAVLGARVVNRPTAEDWAWAERVVLVKRAGVQFATAAQQSGLPIVWDALDFWQQPVDNQRSEQSAKRLLRETIAAIRPTLVIGATEAMATEAGGICLPHHGYLDLSPTPARARLTTIGYDGNPVFLDVWADALKRLCAARGWTFVVNPPDLRACDVLVALRGGQWDGWMCREWKSGVKLANAILAGRPVITQDTAAMRELRPAGSVIEKPSDLPDAVDEWLSFDRRQEVVAQSQARAAAFSVEAMAHRYASILANLREVARC